MVRQEEGRWDVSIKSNAVCLERIADGDEQLFEDSLSPEEARALAGLLRKFADKVDEADKSDKSEESGKSEDTDKSDDSDDSEDSDKSED
jgi:hypothetical protein